MEAGSELMEVEKAQGESAEGKNMKTEGGDIKWGMKKRKESHGILDMGAE